MNFEFFFVNHLRNTEALRKWQSEKEIQMALPSSLQNPNGNVTLDPGNDSDIGFQVQLDVYL